MENILMLDSPVEHSPWIASLAVPRFGTHGPSIIEELHSELELVPLLNKYLILASQRLNLSGLVFSWQQEEYQIGDIHCAFQHSFLLRIDAEYMVKLTYFSHHEISEFKRKKLQSIQQQAFYPIRNALKYAVACRAARQDHLTGLGNRGYFHDVIRYQIQQAQRFDQQLAVMMIDLDNFKQVNDTHGHAEGDKLLVQFADILKNVIRSSDLAFRLGGDEFVFLLANSDEKACHTLANRLQEAVRNHTLMLRRGVTCSIGFAQWQNEEELGNWLKRSDKALYMAKAAGRDCAVPA